MKALWVIALSMVAALMVAAHVYGMALFMFMVTLPWLIELGIEFSKEPDGKEVLNPTGTDHKRP